MLVYFISPAHTVFTLKNRKSENCEEIEECAGDESSEIVKEREWNTYVEPLSFPSTHRTRFTSYVQLIFELEERTMKDDVRNRKWARRIRHHKILRR